MNSFVSSNSGKDLDHGDVSSYNTIGNAAGVFGALVSIQHQIDALCQKMDTWDAVLYMPCVQNNCYHDKFDIFQCVIQFTRGVRPIKTHIWIHVCIALLVGLMELDIRHWQFFCLK